MICLSAPERIYIPETSIDARRNEEVMQAVVVPAPNTLKAHVPFAWIVKREGSSLDEQAVKEYALENGPVYAHPRRVFFVDALPLSGTNKIDRRALEAEAVKKTREGGGAD